MAFHIHRNHCQLSEKRNAEINMQWQTIASICISSNPKDNNWQLAVALEIKKKNHKPNNQKPKNNQPTIMLPIYKWGCMRSCPRSYKEFSFPSLGGVAQKNNPPFPWTAWSWAKGNPNHTGSVSDRSYGGMSPSDTTSKSKICSCRSFIAIDYFYRAPPLQLQEPLDLSK